ncbi:MAG: ABC transporter permease [Bacillati bacterium ANGP1]|uniref:ABC transporter permease n=1 Tax=Candidatus Segetimicrobium genomatis TaxID=2569760 RepID=A0A537JGD5_9BACT|nr:MAG: ABC transporter permease [Terrabacteria group bacterium ANGP1]
MRGTFVIAQKEVRQIFSSPIAYVALAMFFLIEGYLFFSLVGVYSLQVLQLQGTPPPDFNPTRLIFTPLYQDTTFVLLLLVPVLTMRLVSEEDRAHTMELLATSPVTATAIVLGKYLAVAALFLVLLAISAYMPLSLALIGRLDWGLLAATYLGLVLLGGAFLAVGLFASTLNENQIVSAAIGFALLLIFWILGFAQQTASPGVQPILQALSLATHFSNLAGGIIDTQDVLFFLSLAGFFLFLGVVALESRRWR